MPKRQVIEIDISFSDTWSELTTKEILSLLANKAVKNIKITNTNKRKLEGK